MNLGEAYGVVYGTSPLKAFKHCYVSPCADLCDKRNSSGLVTAQKVFLLKVYCPEIVTNKAHMEYLTCLFT